MGRAKKNSADRRGAARAAVSTSPSPGSASRAPVWALILVLLLAAAVPYLQTLDHDFIKLDDDQYVTANAMVRQGLSGEGVAWAFTSFEAANWHPLTWLSHMLDVELFGLDAGAHHGVSVLLHALNTLLLFWVFLRLFGHRWAAFLIAALFALHPTHVESVAWVSERKDVLSTAFWLLTLLAYLRWVERPSAGRYGALLAAFALGLMAKPMLVTLPFVLLLLDAWPLRRLRGFETAGEAVLPGPASKEALENKSLWGLVLEKLPLFALTAASSAITLAAQRAGGAVESFEALGLWGRLSNAAVGYLRYLGKLFWPQDLSLYYPLHEVPPVWQALLALVLLAAVTAGAWLWRRQRPWLALGWLWFLGTLVPVVGLVQVGGQAIADRYTYVPSIGLGILLAGALTELAARRPPLRPAVLAGCAIVLAVLGWLTFLQAAYWENTFTLFERSIAVTEDNYLLQNNLGAAYTERGQPEKAVPLLEAAVATRPAYSEAHNNLGLAQLRRGQPEKAAASYRRALELEPRRTQVAINLGEALAAAGQLDEATAVLRRAVEEGGGAQAHNNLGSTLAQSGNLAAALEQYRRALELDPDYASAHANRAQVLAAQGRLDEAAAAFRRSVELDPDNPQTLTNYATVLADLGQVGDAVTLLRRAVRLAPGLPQARFFLGLGLLSTGDRNGAIEQYQALTQLAPGMAEQLGREIQAAGP
ncbi:MAG: tetratricopeptide repeat protein [Acidobacteriota bacterium]|nr:tetratricopeptide repeat protein [Acidobacteriota bacterium]